MQKIIWRAEKRKIDELKPFEGNPRQATEKQKEDLSKSLERFDLAEPIVINTDNTIIGGHFRWRILKEKGIEEVDVRVPNRALTRKEEEELNLRLNKNLGEWNLDLLANFDEELLKESGWSAEELDEIFGLEVDDEFDVEKELNKILAGKERRCKEGDLFGLGEHKLYIGSATDRESWEKVLGNERFDFLLTDPPYKLQYVKDLKKYKKKAGFGYKQRRRYLGVERMGRIPDYDEWLSIAKEFQNPQGVNIMIFENWRNTVILWQAIEKYWRVCNQIIWHTPNRHQGFARKHHFFQKYDIATLADKNEAIFNNKYEQELKDYLQEKGQKLLDSNEIILYGKSGKSYFDRGKKGTSWIRMTDHITWEVVSSKEGSIIFGAKPLQILVPYIKILSPREGIVMDCFGGSGSTLIACEIMKRKARLIEIEPIYGEIILARFEKFTGLKAKKL